MSWPPTRSWLLTRARPSTIESRVKRLTVATPPDFFASRRACARGVGRSPTSAPHRPRVRWLARRLHFCGRRDRIFAPLHTRHPVKHEVRIPVLSVFRVVLCVAALAACGGDDDSGDGGGGGGGTPGQDAGPRPDADVDRVLSFPADRVGWSYLVEGVAGFDGVSAALFDAPDVPEPALVAAEGDCEVWARPDAPALCDPPCQGGYCVADNQCVPLPQPVTAGTITVDGLTGPLQFVESGPYYQPDPAIPPEDLFADDATITATAPGGDLDGFSLEAGGVAPLEAQLDLEYDVTLVIEDEVDEVIRWTPESSGEIQLALLTG